MQIAHLALLLRTCYFYFQKKEIFTTVQKLWKSQITQMLTLKSELKTPKFSFGIITDLQYADADDRQNPSYINTRCRRYRNSLPALAEAVQFWNSCRTEVCFVLNLGDIIDGLSSFNNTHKEVLKMILKEFKNYNGSVYHVWGNHELFSFGRSYLLQTDLATMPYSKQYINHVNKAKAYYEFSIHEKFCFVVIDTYDISIFGYEKSHPKYIEAESLLESKNPNENKTSTEGLTGMNRRYVNFNGALSEEQLVWLDEVLARAQQQKKWVIISGKLPFSFFFNVDYIFCREHIMKYLPYSL